MKTARKHNKASDGRTAKGPVGGVTAGRSLAGARRVLQAGAALAATVCVVVVFLFATDFGSRTAPQRPVRVVATFPHDAEAFTQGLVYHDGFFYEGTGLRGASSLRKVNPGTGEVVQRVDLPESHFGEGIAISRGRILQLTWQAGKGFVRDLETFDLTGEFSYTGEGWGLAARESEIVMSDGTATLRWLDPETFDVTRKLIVKDVKHAVAYLNELEFVGDRLYANVWKSNRIAAIDPQSGRVEQWLSLKTIPEARGWRPDGRYVANGIAWDPEAQRLFVTGKNWSKVYELKMK